MQSYLEIPVDTKKLAACLHRPASSVPAPVVICCHGLTGTRVGTSYRLVALGRHLAERGIACLRFDFRGCGESDGRFEDVTPQTLLEDLLAAIKTLERTPEIDASRKAIVGSSFGAYTASRAAAQISGLKCLVFLAPVADPRALIARAMTEEAWALLRSRGWIEHHGLPLSAAFMDGLPEENVPDCLPRTHAPLLIFHGLADKEVPIAQGRAYEAAIRRAGGTVDFRELDAPDHGMRGVSATDTIVSGAVDWCARFLRGHDSRIASLSEPRP